MKRKLIAAAVVAVLAAAASAWSQPYGMGPEMMGGYGMGPGMMWGYGPGGYGVDLSAEQREQLRRGGRGR